MNATDWPALPGTENALAMFTIYDRPVDFPWAFVVRRCFACADEGLRNDEGLLFDVVPRLASSLAEARALVPRGLFRQPRQEGDDPFIVEVWF